MCLASIHFLIFTFFENFYFWLDIQMDDDDATLVPDGNQLEMGAATGGLNEKQLFTGNSPLNHINNMTIANQMSYTKQIDVPTVTPTCNRVVSSTMMMSHMI